MKINKAKLRQIINEEVASFIGEKKDKVSKKISYLMDKEDKPQDQAVAIALSMKDRGELEEGFKSGEKITHDEYGDGVVTHPGTKNTDVAVKFEKDTGRGKSIKVSRGALKKAVKEEMDAMRGALRPGAGIEDIEQPEPEEPSRKVSGETARETILAFMRAREELVKMSANDRRAFRSTLDPAQAEVFDHIISHPLYRPIPKHMLPKNRS